MHEIMHGIVSERGISLPDEDSKFTSEETIASEFAKAVIELIRDNPDLIEYLKEA